MNEWMQTWCASLQGINLVWESYKLDTYVQRLAEAIFNFQEKMDDLVAMEEEIEVEVRSLDTCAYSNGVMNEILSKIQKAVDDLSLHQYSNLAKWVSNLDEQVNTLFLMRWQARRILWRRVAPIPLHC